uniref:Uncharacterized protein n=1 Tax=Kalanchoe fedtschenkoi TaxID=63787 RepID=A0A7N0RF15_KALFE
MSPAAVTAILLAVVASRFASSSTFPPQVDIGSRCHERDSICDVNDMKLKVARFEAMLEEKSENLKSKSDLHDALEQRNYELAAEILILEAQIEELKGGELLPEDEVVSQLEEEVQSLWSISRKNNFDLHILESQAVEAEERLVDVKSEVEKMADVVTENWIQIRHLEQALQGAQIKTAEIEKQLCLQKCSFFERLPLLLDQHVSKNLPDVKLYWSKVLKQLQIYLSAVKKYHLQLQQFVRQEIEKNRLTAAYSSEEVVFFLASALLTFPILCTLMLLLSLLH